MLPQPMNPWQMQCYQEEMEILENLKKDLNALNNGTLKTTPLKDFMQELKKEEIEKLLNLK